MSESKILKRCHRCEKVKLIEDFRRRKDKYEAICKECTNITHKKWMEKNKESAYARHRIWVRNNRESVAKQRAEYRRLNAERLRVRQNKWRREHIVADVIRQALRNAKIRCAKKQMPVTVTVEELLLVLAMQDNKCALSGVKLTFASKSKCIATSCSLDRIDQSKGYVTGNVRFLCHSVNSFRGSMSDGEFKQFVENIEWKWPKLA